MRLLKLLLTLLVGFVLGAFAGYKITLVRDVMKTSKHVTFIEEGRLAQSGARVFTAYRTNKNDAVVYLLSEHIADLEKELKNFPKNFPDDQVRILYAKRDLGCGLVLNYGRLAILKGDKEGEDYVQKALQLSVNWTPPKKYPQVVDRNSLFNYVKAKDTANEFW